MLYKCVWYQGGKLESCSTRIGVAEKLTAVTLEGVEIKLNSGTSLRFGKFILGEKSACPKTLPKHQVFDVSKILFSQPEL